MERIGRFEVVDFVGEGGFGAVWRVKDPIRPRRALALKVLRGDESRGIDSHSEHRCGVQVRHPSVLEVLEEGPLGDSPLGGSYLLSEYFEGEPIAPPRDPSELTWVALDFGLASETGTSGIRGAGTPRYQAPEVLSGSTADSRSDLYSLGLLLWEALGCTSADTVAEHILRTRQGLFFEDVRAAELPNPARAAAAPPARPGPVNTPGGRRQRY